MTTNINGANERQSFETIAAAVPPAHGCCNSWFASLPEGRQAVLRDDKWMLAHAAFDAGRAAAVAVPPLADCSECGGFGFRDTDSSGYAQVPCPACAQTGKVAAAPLAAPAAVAGPLHREWRSAVQEAIDTMEAEIENRVDAENVRRMKRATSILLSMLAAPTTQAAPDRPEPPRHLSWNDVSDWLAHHPLPDWLTPAQKYRYKYVGNIRARVGFEEWSRNEGRPVEMTSEGMYTGRLTAQNDWCVWLAACAANTPHQAPAAQGDAELLSMSQALFTQREADARDAARYRRLRLPRLAVGHGSIFVVLDDRGKSGNLAKHVCLDELDAAVDAALGMAKDGGA